VEAGFDTWALLLKIVEFCTSDIFRLRLIPLHYTTPSGSRAYLMEVGFSLIWFNKGSGN